MENENFFSTKMELQEEETIYDSILAAKNEEDVNEAMQNLCELEDNSPNNRAFQKMGRCVDLAGDSTLNSNIRFAIMGNVTENFMPILKRKVFSGENIEAKQVELLETSLRDLLRKNNIETRLKNEFVETFLDISVINLVAKEYGKRKF